MNETPRGYFSMTSQYFGCFTEARCLHEQKQHTMDVRGQIQLPPTSHGEKQKIL